MLENEVKNYDGQINSNSIEAADFGLLVTLPPETVEAASCLEEVSPKTEMRFARRRISRRVKARGIF